MACWLSAAIAVLAFVCLCDQVVTLHVQQQLQQSPLFPLPAPSLSANNNNNRPASPNLAAAEDEGFLAQLHRRITQANKHGQLSNANHHATDQRPPAAPQQQKNRFDRTVQQQRLQRLQNYFGPQVADALQQWQEQSSSLNSLSAPLEAADTVAHVVFSPETRFQQQQQMELENVDALRKYHLRPSSDSETPFDLRSPFPMPAEQTLPTEEEWENLLQQLAAERALEGGNQGFSQQLNDESLQDDQSTPLQPKSLQQAADEEFTREQLAALVRHAPLNAILAQAQRLAQADRRQPKPETQESPDSESSLPYVAAPSAFSRSAQAALAEQDAKTDRLNQLIMKKQSLDNNPPPSPVEESVASVQTSALSPAKEDSSQNFSTQLKKVEISSKNGRQLRKEESYERSIQLSPSEVAKEQQRHATINQFKDEHAVDGEQQLLLTPAQSHLERATVNQVRQPIAVQLRNAPDSTTPITRTLTGRLSNFGDFYFLLLVVGCSAASILSVIGAGVCFYKFQQHHKATADVDYPAYGVIGPLSKPPISPGAEQPLQTEPKSKADSRKTGAGGETGSSSGQTGAAGSSAGGSGNETAPSGDRKLAQSAQMYHYQHQKQQMIASEK